MTTYLNSDSVQSLQEQRADLVKALPWSSEIFLPTDKLSLRQQVDGLKRVVDLQNNRLFQTYAPQIKAFRDRYKTTKRCFIIGNGPSLNETDLSQLEHEVTFCVNGFFLKMPELNWTPTFYVVEDHLVAEDRAQAINALRGPTKLFPAYLAYCLNEGADTVFFNHRGRLSYPDGFDFSTDASKVTYTGCTVTFTCMQLAHYMGFREIYLIGVDASYEIPDDTKQADAYGTGILDMQSDDPNHFHPDYFGKGFRWHDPQVNKMIEAYSEARRVSDSLKRPIYNATIGGKLEVFERRQFSTVFPSSIPPETLRRLEDKTELARRKTKRNLEEKARNARLNTSQTMYPKIALIDMTPAEGITATGALKAKLFSDWPEERFLQIFADRKDEISLQGAPLTSAEAPLNTRSEHHAAQIISAFDPDVILYRPLPERPILQRVYENTRVISGASRLIWVMDDWPEKLRQEENYESAYLDAKLRQCLNDATACLSISEEMSSAYKERYGLDFVPISNGVDLEEWTNTCPEKNGPIRVRYAGNLSETMSLSTLLILARTIDSLAETIEIEFEIQTREHWARLHGEKFNAFKATRVCSEPLSDCEYKDWLMAAHISVIAYNFDDITISYVRYSMANKLPELLASGSMLLAIGPENISTMGYLSRYGLGIRVHNPSIQAIKDALNEYLNYPAKQSRLIQDQRKHVERHLSMKDARSRFFEQIVSASRQRNVSPDKIRQAYLDFLVAPNISGHETEAITMAHKPTHLEKPKYKRMLLFYAGWRGVIAAAAILFSALPAARAMFASDWLGMLVDLGPVSAVFLLIAFIAYLFTVLEEHFYT